LAQRTAAVFGSPSTLHRLLRRRGWRRPTLRIHPDAPTEGIRAERPNQLWHIDTTVIRLLNHTKVYLHAVLDNFSRRVLAWTIADRFDPGNALAVLVLAGRQSLEPLGTPTVMADAGVENRNRAVDQLIASGVLTRVLAQTEIHYSNSLIEAWWRCLKHQWLFMHELTTLSQVRALVEFYVREHNTKIPHSAFKGQTPDEMYFGTGAEVPDRLAQAKRAARTARLAENRAARCDVCA
jgi:transposase InsO family protein